MTSRKLENGWGGAVASGFQNHHLITSTSLGNSRLLQDLKGQRFYDQKGVNNTQRLPTASDGSEASPHNGWDVAHKAYNNYINTGLNVLAGRVDRCDEVATPDVAVDLPRRPRLALLKIIGQLVGRIRPRYFS